jgi:predicted PurR-regulated permease PerM
MNFGKKASLCYTISMETKIIEKYFFFGLLAATLIFTFLIFRPFWVVLVLGASFSIVLYPIFEWFTKGRLPNYLASFLTVIFFTIILCGPILGIGALVFKQTKNIYSSLIEKQGSYPIMDSINDSVNNLLPEGVTFDMKARVNDFVSYLSHNVASVFTSTVSAFFSFLLMLLIIFFFLKDGAKWKKAILVLSPLSDKNDEKIIEKLSIAINSVMMGNLFIALIQGVLMGIGLWIFNVPNPAVWGLVASVASFIPTIGTSLISIPAMIFLFSSGHTPSAIGLLVWAGVIVGLVDNFLSPVIIGEKINVPPLLILFSVLGGISLLGPVGALLGPLTVSFLYTLIAIYRNEFKQNAQNIPA